MACEPRTGYREPPAARTLEIMSSGTTARSTAPDEVRGAAPSSVGGAVAPSLVRDAARADAVPEAVPEVAGATAGAAGRRGRLRLVPALLPGLAVASVGVAVGWALNRALPAVAPLTAAVVLGVLLANVYLPAVLEPGLRWAAKHCMRAGIVVLGLQLALGNVLALGWRALLLVLAVVTVTFFGTWWLGRRLRVHGRQPLLIATGFAICGASAVAAMDAVTRPHAALNRTGAADAANAIDATGAEGAANMGAAETGNARNAAGAEGVAGRGRHDATAEHDVLVAVALVTLCGSLAIAVLPLLGGPLGLHGTTFGRWVGASVHDIGQVVATASTAGPDALHAAVVVKLMRVVLLAPMVMLASVLTRRQQRAAEAARATAAAGAALAPADRAKRPPIVPLFVVGFLLMIALRSTGVLSTAAVGDAQTAQNLLLAAGLFGLGSAVRLRTLLRTGPRPLLLAGVSWLLVAAVSYAGVLLT
jgi:uncharacterized membrane protein YadS